MNNIIIRPMYPWDIETVANVIRRGISDDERDILEFRIDINRGAICFVACMDEAIVGSIVAARSFSASGIWEIGWCVVDEQFRCKGIGTALLKSVEGYALNQNASMVILSSGDKEFHARRGYDVSAESHEDTLMTKLLLNHYKHADIPSA